jgi:hypothetical protein
MIITGVDYHPSDQYIAFVDTDTGEGDDRRLNQGRKSLCMRCIGVLRIWWFDPVAEASELPKHLPRAELLRSFGDRRAPFLVTDSVVQDQPDQATLSTGNGPDSLIMSETRDRTTINNFEDTSFSFYSGVSCLFE